jgi:hypothetical protein
MKLRKIFPILFVLASFVHEGKAQSYKSAVGLRIGTEFGITYKQLISNRVTLEGILQRSFDAPTNRFTLLGAGHLPLITKHFNMYGGAGAHVGSHKTKDDVNETHGGLSLIAGAELTLGRLNISWDVKPALNIIGAKTYTWLDMNSALSVRYVLVKRTEPHKKSKNKKNPKRKSRRAKI